MVEEFARVVAATGKHGLPRPSGFNRFERFRRALGRSPLSRVVPLPAVLQDDLCAWVLWELTGRLLSADVDTSDLPPNTIKPSTLSSYVRDCINRVYAVFGVALDRPSGLGKLVSAAEQEYVGRARDSRFAASPALVRAACDDARRRGEWGLLAGLLLGYVGLMRCAEFAAQTVRGFDVDRGLRVRDVKFGSAGGVATAVVTVRYRKTDSYNRGSAVSFAATGGPYCVVAALRHAVAGRPLDSVDPLLLRSDGLLVTSSLVFAAVKAGARAVGLNAAFFGPHSLRVGGAARLTSMAVPPTITMLRGDWKSPVMLSYLRESFGVAAVVCRALSADRPVPYDAAAVGAIETSISDDDCAKFMYAAQGDPGLRARRPSLA